MAELTARMVNACFRKGPRSWTAALSALEFFGFTPAAFVSDRPGGFKVGRRATPRPLSAAINILIDFQK